MKNDVLERRIDSGLLIVIDIVESADEEAVFSDLKRRVLQRNLHPYDAVAHQKLKNNFPAQEEIPRATQVLFLSEPSHTYIGGTIRALESTRDGHFGKESFASQDAADRKMQFDLVTVPFLKRGHGRIVIQNRGLISSVARFSARHTRLTPQMLYSLPGNRETLERPPDIIFLVKRRDAGCRRTPVDYRVAELLHADGVTAPFRRYGTWIKQVDALDSPKAIAKRIFLDMMTLRQQRR